MHQASDSKALAFDEEKLKILEESIACFSFKGTAAVLEKDDAKEVLISNSQASTHEPVAAKKHEAASTHATPPQHQVTSEAKKEVVAAPS